MNIESPLKQSGSPESVHDFLSQKKSGLDVFFKPRSVALVGATENPGSVGRTVLKNLLANPFGGTVYPVNPKRPNVLGVKAYAKVKDIPEPVDLAVVVTPAIVVPGVIRECAEAKIPGAIVISAGFKEIGPAGAELEKQIMVEAGRNHMRIVGPNCLGIMNPQNGFNASFAPVLARNGHVGFISQSGALMAAILDWSLQEKVGFSQFVSMGSMLDVDWGDMIDYLGDDPQTKSIVIYMETIGNARSFLSAAREVALTKPIIVIKAGRTEGAAKAAASHTGSLAGSDEVMDAAFRRCGVLRVSRISDLFYMSEVLDKQPRPKGPRLTIITNAGGPGVLATDALLQTGGQLSTPSEETIKTMNAFLPAAWSHNNPIDVLGDADPTRYAKTLEAAGRDTASDGLLVILTPQAMTDATGTAEALRPLAQTEGKPVLASWMGGDIVQAGVEELRDAGIPVFSYPDEAARMFTYMWEYAHTLEGLYETPMPAAIAEEGETPLERSRALIERVKKSGRDLFTEAESKELLGIYGIPTTPILFADTEEGAIKAANTVRYPVVVKLHSETLTHKTDVGGVILNLCDDNEVRKAFQTIRSNVSEKASLKDFQGVSVQPMIRWKDSYELIIGSSVDPQLGPVLLFGSGGQLVEVYKDKSLGLPPLNTTLARRLMEGTKIYKALQGVRGRKPIDIKALDQLLVRFSQMVSDHPRIKEIDINPLLVSPQGLMALDARVVLHGVKIKDDQLPVQPIRPYPSQYVSSFKLTSGSPVRIRPIRHQDEPMLVKFHQTLSEQNAYLRYLQTLQPQPSPHITQERLLRRCFIDYDREMALVAEAKNGSETEMVGIARLVKLHSGNQAEFAILVGDQIQHQGLGAELMKRLIQIARDEKIAQLTADVLRENHGMLSLLKQFHFQIQDNPAEPVLKTVLSLN